MATKRFGGNRKSPELFFRYISFNCEDGALGHREVRQALTYATDRETLVHTLMRDQARVADGPLPQNNWAYEANVPKYEYDPAKAEALLDQAGFRRGRCKDWGSPAPYTKTSPILWRDCWERCFRTNGGMWEWNSSFVRWSSATFYADITKGNFQLYTLRWVGANNDPDFFDYTFNSHKIPPAGANRGRYRNPSLTLSGPRACGTGPRETPCLYSQVQQIIAGDLRTCRSGFRTISPCTGGELST